MISAYLADDLDVGSSRTIIWRHGVDDANDVALHHPDVVRVAVFTCDVKEMLNKIHDIGPCVHIRLQSLSATALGALQRQERLTRSTCSRMHECRSSSISLYLRAYCAAFCAEETDAFKC